MLEWSEIQSENPIKIVFVCELIYVDSLFMFKQKEV